MSVTAINAFSTATGNGATTSFPYTFAAKSAAEVAVYVNGALQTVGFTVTPNAGGNGGTVLFTVAPANAAAIIMATAPSLQQSTTFVNAGAYNPASVDGANDEAAIRDIFLKGLIDRAMLFPLGETAAALPSAANRANKYLAFDGSGVPVMLAGTTGGSGLTNGTFGDIIVTGAGATMTLGPGAVTLAKMANLAANSILGNNTGAGATPLALTPAQVAAMLPAMVGDSGAGGTKGLVTAPAAGDAAAGKVWGAGGAWVVPAGGGAGTTTNALTFSSAGDGDVATSTFTGAFGRKISWNSIGATRAGAITSGDLTISTAKLAGRTTAATGAVQEIGIDATLQLTALTLSVLKVPNAVTFQASGGAAPGTTFDGTAARVVDPSTIGAAAARPTISAHSTSFSAADSDNNSHIVLSGAGQTLTLGNLTAGTSFTARATTAWSLAVAGGLSKNGAAPGGVTTGSIAANSLITFLTEGSGVWTVSSSGLT